MTGGSSPDRSPVGNVFSWGPGRRRTLIVASSWPAGWARLWWRSKTLLLRHRLTLLVAFPFIAVSYLLPLPDLPLVRHRYWSAVGIGLASVAFAAAAAIHARRPVPWRRLPGAILACVACQAFLDAFMRWKAFMPNARPFTWDERLDRFNVLLHGGQALAFRLRPLLGGPIVLRVLDTAYYLWFPVIVGVVLYQAWRGDRLAAARFALAFVLSWIILGVILAYLMSSAGPVFYAQLTGNDRFIPLLEGVRAAGELRSPRVATELWSLWQSLHASSIAAMPSMHVAMPVLCACAFRRASRYLFIAYAIVIFLGSIMLGWHYAIDGYVATAGVLAIWGMTRSALPSASERTIRTLIAGDGGNS